MDPDANLKQQLEIALAIQSDYDAGRDVFARDVERLTELVVALDGWIRGGGFLPIAWAKGGR